MKLSTCLRWLFLNSCIIATALPNDHFIEFFKDTNQRFKAIMENNCSFEVGQYYHIYDSDCPSYWEWPSCLSSKLTSCILSHTEEVYKADMSAAGVLLGLLPSILTLVAPSIVENGLLSMRRPGLGFLLALGSPMVSPIRVFDLQDPQDVLRAVNTDSGQILQVGSMRALAISLLEYMLAMGSLVNCVALAYEIGIKTICSFASAVIYLPLLWTMTPFVIHALAIWSIRLRVRLVAQPVEVEIEGPSWAFLSHEARLSMVQPPFRLEGKPKTFLSNSVFWFTTICTLTHIIFGTLVFSSIIFVSVQDAVTRIWIRYLVSALVCRAIFVFEFSGMRKVSI